MSNDSEWRTVEITGELLAVFRAIQDGEDVCYRDVTEVTGIPISACHTYVKALQDLGLVEITDGGKRGGFAKKRLKERK